MENRLKTADILKIYNITTETLSQWKRRLGLPHRKMGRECYFLISEIESWEEQFKYPRQQLPKNTGKNHITSNMNMPSKRRAV